MKSFKEYLKYRKEISIVELAAPRIKIGERETGQRIKTPIQLDSDDINFLKQFPPEFWAQALNRRYGILLYKAHEAAKEGGKIPETLPVDIKGNGGVNLRFTVHDAKMNDLYEKLSGDEDSLRYSKLKPEDLEDEDLIRKNYYSDEKGEPRTRSEYGKLISPYGYDFNNFVVRQQGKESLGQADGYVVPDLDVCQDTINQWMNHLQQGWYDDETEGSDLGEVKTGAGTKKLPISGVKTWESGKDFQVLGSGRSSKTKKKSSYKNITSGIPDVKPGFHVLTSELTKHDHYLKVASELVGFSSNYLSLFSKEYLLNPTFDDIDIIDQAKVAELNQNLAVLIKSKKKNEKEIIELKKLLEFAAYLTDSKNSKNFVELYKAYKEVASGDDQQKHETAIKNAIEKVLEKVRDFVNQKRIDVIRNAKRYNVHQWNSLRHNSSLEMSPIKNLSQVGGVVASLKQQAAREYQAIRNIFDKDDEKVSIFWSHLLNDLRITDACLNGVINQIGQLNEDVTQISMGDKYIRSLKEAMYENRQLIAQNAVNQFQFKIGSTNSVKEYARQYKGVIDGEITKESFSKDEKTNKTKSKIIRAAVIEGLNYSNQVYQLHARFLRNKYNRKQDYRPENPWEISKTGSTLLEIIDMFHSSNISYQDLSPRTSHSIETLEDTIHRIKASGAASIAVDSLLSTSERESESKIKSNDLDNKDKKVNSTDSEKAMNASILQKTIQKFSDRIRSSITSVGSVFSKWFAKKPASQTAATTTDKEEPAQTQGPEQTEQKPVALTPFQRWFGKQK